MRDMQTTRGTPLSGAGPTGALRSGSGAGDEPDTSADAVAAVEGDVAADGSGRRRHIGVLIVVAAMVIIGDVVSKILVVANLTDHAPIKLLGGLITLEETRNPGAAFSVGTSATLIFGVVAIAVIAIIVRTARRLFSRPWSIVLGLLLGGATGNLIDRVLRSPGVLRGYVVDWIRVPHFAVFNVADSAITVGGTLAVLLAISGRQLDGSRATSARRTSDDDSQS